MTPYLIPSYHMWNSSRVGAPGVLRRDSVVATGVGVLLGGILLYPPASGKTLGSRTMQGSSDGS